MADLTFAKEFLGFVDKSPSPFHAVETASSLLTSKGFTEISESVAWTSIIKPGGKYVALICCSLSRKTGSLLIVHPSSIINHYT